MRPLLGEDTNFKAGSITWTRRRRLDASPEAWDVKDTSYPTRRRLGDAEQSLEDVHDAAADDRADGRGAGNARAEEKKQGGGLLGALRGTFF